MLVFLTCCAECLAGETWHPSVFLPLSFRSPSVILDHNLDLPRRHGGWTKSPPAPNHILPSRFPSVPLPFSFRSARGANWELRRGAAAHHAHHLNKFAKHLAKPLLDESLPSPRGHDLTTSCFPSVFLPFPFRYAVFLLSTFLTLPPSSETLRGAYFKCITYT